MQSDSFLHKIDITFYNISILELTGFCFLVDICCEFVPFQTLNGKFIEKTQIHDKKRAIWGQMQLVSELETYYLYDANGIVNNWAQIVLAKT